MKTPSLTTFAAAAALLSALASPAQAQGFAPIDISSGSPGWNATHAGASGPAYTFTNRCSTASACMSVSSTGYVDGVLAGGGTGADFTGRWTATLDVWVPPHAGAVRMDLQVDGIDDRATFRLNGVPLLMALRQDGAVWTLGLVGGPLRAGQSNRLEVEVVNNPARSDGRPLPFQGEGDGTAVSFTGRVTALP